MLFVDDEHNVLESLKRGLLEEEYISLFALSGAQALKIMAEQDIAVIVSDMRMPEMDGLSLLKEVKKLYPKTVRIVLSGYTQIQQILVTINQADIFRFITKPWRMESEFKSVIISALDYYILQEENEKTKKALEKKTFAYQNMLKQMEDKLELERKRGKLPQVIARQFFQFNAEETKRTFDEMTGLTEAYKKIIIIQEEIYALIYSSPLVPREIIEEELVLDIMKQIKKYMPIFGFENRIECFSAEKRDSLPISLLLSSFLLILWRLHPNKGCMYIVERADGGKIKLTLLFEKEENLAKVHLRLFELIQDTFRMLFAIFSNLELDNEEIRLTVIK